MNCSRNILLLLLMVTTGTGVSSAQRTNRASQRAAVLNTQSRSLNDSINAIGQSYATRLDSLTAAARTTISSNTDAAVALSNPYFYPVFASSTLLQLPLSTTIGTLHPNGYLASASGLQSSIIPSIMPEIFRTATYAYVSHPTHIRYNLTRPIEAKALQPDATEHATIKDAPNNAETRRQAEESADAPIELTKEDHSALQEPDLGDFYIHVRKPNFWTLKGNFALQFMQYYVSQNWYKGGDSHLSMLGMMTLEANYNNKQKLTFDNKLEMKLGFQTTPGDSKRKLQTNADLIRLTNKLGVRAHKHWYYTAMLQSWTQFYKAYDPGTDNVRSQFLTPFESVLSLGMDYELTKKRAKLSVNIAPLAANLKYCHQDDIVTLHGIEEGKNAKIDLGANITATMKLQIMQQVDWESRLYAFYDYRSRAKVEWENTINLHINKYLSTKLFLYPRFDNNTPKTDENDSYLQFNEYLSVGLDLKF